MRTTVTLSDDVRAEVDRLRREEGLGTSDAINTLARRGLQRRPESRDFVQRTAELNARIDLSDIGAVLELLDDP